MRLRAPSVPLITVDPYFSVWSPADRLTDTATRHWTNRPMQIDGTATIDGVTYRFMGDKNADTIPAMEQLSLDVEALTTTYVFCAAGVELTVLFTTPIIPTDYYLISRPVSYMEVLSRAIDGEEHSVVVNVAVSEQICLHEAGQDAVVTEMLEIGGLPTAKMGSASQPVLHCSGDDRRIDWGYFYLTVAGGTVCSLSREQSDDGMAYVTATAPLDESVLFTFAYDDIESIQYFGKNLSAYWKSVTPTIEAAIAEAHADYLPLMEKCKIFSDTLFADAVRAGGEKYAELLLLALRQSIGAHKLVLDENGELLFISKENFSNGCAATVDVSYPSIPLYLLYNPALVQAMMRPIYRFARSDAWKFDFAPHDAGQYPLVNGQVYALNRQTGVLEYNGQMPVEECGNMLMMEASAAVALGNADFAKQNLDLLEQWVKYLIDNGDDPANQLCTDDFAGHLSHNCNLTLKAIMGIAALGILYRLMGDEAAYEKHLAIAREKAQSFIARARNTDGSYRLAFDREDTFSLKYNLIWDKIFGTDIMPAYVSEAEVQNYIRKTNAYGVPLDSRRTYTKTDWIVWAAALGKSRDDFEALIAPVWYAYHCSPSRVPLSDWFDTVTSTQCGFQCRTVVGGFFMQLLAYKGYLKL
ncbi:MAG: DUF4965 domain-containing protein [Clostridia bacterium]|nr:DUF4965 domain-containing protein [Clostridia bacterium]MBQ7339175.1 DUF4965 domain-containing protein [Clostridia bacterium]